MACHEGELSILFTGDRRISLLNSEYLGRQGPTNVLSFPMADPTEPSVASGMLGDVVISVDTARAEAKESDEDVKRTVYRLLIHGLLHLLGYDHEASIQEAARMSTQEERLLNIVTEG